MFIEENYLKMSTHVVIHSVQKVAAEERQLIEFM